VTLETTELRFPSRIEAVDQTAAAVLEFLSRAGVGEDAVFGIDMAVREAVTNAVSHGNKLDETKFVEVGLKSSPTLLRLQCTTRDPGSIQVTSPIRPKTRTS